MKPSGARPPVRLWDAACLMFFVLFWLVPIAYTGLTSHGVPGAPYVFTYLTSVSCLFTVSAPYTAFDYIQIQTEPGARWTTIPDAPYFRFAPFGYRTRLDEYLRSTAFEGAVAEEFSEWFRWRYSQLNPSRPPLAGVRLVAGMVPVTAHVPRGRWQKPPLESLPPGVARVWLTKQFRE